MQTIDVWATAKRLVAEHGETALVLADTQALGEMLCGETEASEAWERVSDAIRSLLDQCAVSAATPTDQSAAFAPMQHPISAGPMRAPLY